MYTDSTSEGGGVGGGRVLGGRILGGRVHGRRVDGGRIDQRRVEGTRRVDVEATFVITSAGRGEQPTCEYEGLDPHGLPDYHGGSRPGARTRPCG